MEMLGKYEIIVLLGEGATAHVYHAKDIQLNREVALKVLKPGLVADRSAFDRFLQEAQAAANLFHEHIATVLDMGEVEGRYFIAMRFVPGKSLNVILKGEGSLFWEDTLCMAQQIGGALDHSHSMGFLHRDVKPSNIIRNDNGNFWLTDFGLVKAMMATSLTSHSGVTLGTPPYIAPEIWRGGMASPALDIYSLACVIIEAITGEILFDGNNTPEIMTKHVLDGPQFPDPWPLDVPLGVKEVLEKALEKQPEKRFQSVMEFVDALELPEEEVSDTAKKEAVNELVPAELSKVPAEDQRVDKKQGEVAVEPREDRQSGVPTWRWTGGIIVLILLGWVILGSRNPIVPTVINTPIPGATYTLVTTATKTSVPTLIVSMDGMELVPAGNFKMGSENGDSDEQPVHTIWLDEYWIGQTEVTNAMYQQCVEAGKCDRPGGTYFGDDAYQEYPIVGVSWYEAQEYCEWAGGRLPTEAEWEKAARGGLEGMKYPWGNEEPVCKKGTENGAQFSLCDGNRMPVGSFAPNEYGLYDMAGNVWEWVADFYNRDYYSYSSQKYPSGPVNGSTRVFRGGSWLDNDSNLRVASRGRDLPDFSYYFIGFRCAFSYSP